MATLFRVLMGILGVLGLLAACLFWLDPKRAAAGVGLDTVRQDRESGCERMESTVSSANRHRVRDDRDTRTRVAFYAPDHLGDVKRGSAHSSSECRRRDGSAKCVTFSVGIEPHARSFASRAVAGIGLQTCRQSIRDTRGRR